MNKLRFLLIVGIIAVPAVFGLGTGPAFAVEPDQFIRDLWRETINSLTGRSVTEAEREKRFRGILHQAFDIRTIARFTLGSRDFIFEPGLFKHDGYFAAVGRAPRIEIDHQCSIFLPNLLGILFCEPTPPR